MRLQVLRDGKRVVADPVHAQCQGLDALQDQERVERRDRRAGVAQRDDAGAADIGRGSQRLGVDDAVVADVRLVEAAEPRLVLGPGELARIDDRPADRGAMAAEVLGQRMHDDVGTVLNGAEQVRRRHGIVDDQRYTMPVRDRGDGRDVGDVALGIAEGLDEHRLGLRVDQRLEGLRPAIVGEARLDAVLRQRVREQVVGAAIQCAGRDDVVAGLGDRQDRVGHGGLAGRQRQGGNAAFEGRDALFQHVLGGIHDAAVDIARHLEVEQVRAVLRAVEGEGHGLVDRHRDRPGRRLRRVAAVHRNGLEAPVFAP